MRARPLAGVLLVFCLGCGPGGPFKYVAVQGVLSYEDGVPVPVGGIQLKFIAQDAPLVEGASPRPAIAHLNAQGQFDCATSYKYGDGLVPGKHKVAILNAVDKNGKPLVPADYTSTSRTPLVIDTSTLPLEIKVPRP